MAVFTRETSYSTLPTFFNGKKLFHYDFALRYNRESKKPRVVRKWKRELSSREISPAFLLEFVHGSVRVGVKEISRVERLEMLPRYHLTNTFAKDIRK